MKVYVVTACQLEETFVCGVTLDYAMAEKIKAHEENQALMYDGVMIIEYDTDQYLPLNEGLKPFEVIMYEDGIEAVPASLENFNHGQVYNDSVRFGRKCSVCDVYAKDEDHAVKLASDLHNKNMFKGDGYVSTP